MGNIQDYKCPNCSGPLIFSAATQQLKCEYCDSEMALKEFEELDAILHEVPVETDYGAYEGEHISDGLQAQHCDSCGGELITDGTTVATECPYCGNTAIVTKQVTDVLKPDYVIPFKIQKEQAKDILKSFYKKKPLLPKYFADHNRIDKLTGAYVPFWLYDCETDSNAVYDATRVKTWVSGNKRYTRTDYYTVTREGNLDFEKIPVDGSAKMDNTVMESIEPYNYGDLAPFSMAYLSGFLADKHDVEFKELQPRIDQRVRKSVDKNLRATVKGYSSVTPKSLNVRVKKHHISYAMFPVWMLNTKWGDKNYNFTMNGQTGNLVGDLPVSKPKAAIFGGGIFSIVSALLILLCYFGIAIQLGASLAVGLIVGAAVAGLVVGLMSKKMKSVRMKADAKNYERNFRLTKSREYHKGSKTTSVIIQTSK